MSKIETPAPVGTQPPPRKRHTLRNVALSVLGAVVVLGVLGSVMNGGRPASPDPVPVPPVAAAPAAPAPQVPVPAPVVAPAPVPAGPVTTRADGRYEVGTGADQMRPGRWHTDGTGLTSRAAYATSTDPGGAVDAAFPIDGPYTVTLKSGATFESHGGATWTWTGK
jgi:hypothetical protein